MSSLVIGHATCKIIALFLCKTFSTIIRILIEEVGCYEHESATKICYYAPKSNCGFLIGAHGPSTLLKGEKHSIVYFFILFIGGDEALRVRHIGIFINFRDNNFINDLVLKSEFYLQAIKIIVSKMLVKVFVLNLPCLLVNFKSEYNMRFNCY